MATTEDRVANTALRECCQDIVDHIIVDEVILRLHSKGRLTLQQYDRLESISTERDKKRQFYRIALADKGSAAFEDILEVLDETAEYKSHADLVDKLRKRHRCVSRRMSHDRTGEVAAAVVEQREETTITSLENRPSNDDDDLNDNRSDSQLPDIVRIETTTQTSQSRALVVEQKISAPTTAAGHNPLHKATGYGGPAPSVVLSLSVGSLTSITQLSSSIQCVNDTTPPPPPSSVKTPALINTGKPVGVTSGLDQSESVNLAASTATKESGFSDSFMCSECSLLRKSKIPLPNMRHLKVIILGDSGVGKTSLVCRYLHGVYENSATTVGVKLDQCYCQHIQRGVNIKLSVWDTAGQERFNWVMSPIHFRDVHAAIIVFDLTGLASLVNAREWKTDLYRRLPDDSNIPILLVGNKCDSFEVDNDIRRRAQQIAEQFGFDDFIEASAKKNHNVDRIFEEAVTLVSKIDYLNASIKVHLQTNLQNTQTSQISFRHRMLILFLLDCYTLSWPMYT